MTSDPSIAWQARLRTMTPARVRLDAAGKPASLQSVLDFQLSHAKARDAIHQPADWDRIRAALGNFPALDLHSRAGDRDIYIRRPDLGRQLDEVSRAKVVAGVFDLAVVIADGLSAHAVTNHAADVASKVIAALPDLAIGPVALVREGRVAVGDAVAEAMGASLCLVLIGERPGLSVSDSLGAYLTWKPKQGTPDSSRNCVSNIHAHGGLSHAQAAALLVFLIRKAREIRATGVALKDDRPAIPRIEGRT